MEHIARILQHLQEARAAFGPGVYTANEHNIPGLEALGVMDYLRFWDWHEAMERRRKREEGISCSSSPSHNWEDWLAPPEVDATAATGANDSGDPRATPSPSTANDLADPATVDHASVDSVVPSIEVAAVQDHPRTPGPSCSSRAQKRSSGKTAKVNERETNRRMTKVAARKARLCQFAVDHLWCMECFRAANNDRAKWLQGAPLVLEDNISIGCEFDVTSPTCHRCGSSDVTCLGPAGLLTGDAINCARILEFIQCRYHENRAEASGLAADEDDKFFSNSARNEATHRVEFSITDKATPATLKIYDQRLKDQRTLLAQQFPAPVPNVRRCGTKAQQDQAVAQSKELRRLWELDQLPRLGFTDRLFMQWQTALKAAYTGFEMILDSPEEHVPDAYKKQLLEQFPVRAKQLW
ncbi:hypothetical protein V8C40DRAFT_260165 [Trichoderma camerunense]